MARASSSFSRAWNPLELDNYSHLSFHVGGNAEAEEEAVKLHTVEYYQRNNFRMTCFVAGCVLSGGILALLCQWFPRLYLVLSSKPAENQPTADYVWADDGSGGMIARIYRFYYGDGCLVYFDVKKCRFVYSPDAEVFQHVHFGIKTTVGELLAMPWQGLTEEQVRILSTLTTLQSSNPQLPREPNLIDIDAKPLWHLLTHKLTHPFYIFQVASAIVWFFLDYVPYACLILIMSATSVAWEVWMTVENDKRLRGMVNARGRRVHVVRRASDERTPVLCEVNVVDLVAGDIVVLQENAPVPSDMVLLNAQCIVDESTLTGEAVPVSKYPIDPTTSAETPFSMLKFKSNVLFGGSQLLQARTTLSRFDGTEKVLGDAALGLVVANGFSTAKGQLFRSILFPKKINFKYYRDSYQVLAILSLVAFGAFLKRLSDGIRAEMSFGMIILTSIDLITIAVPPALPLVLTVGIGLAMKRLEKRKIFCTDPERINFANVDVMCFDKTGTLTKPEMDFIGAQRAKAAEGVAAFRQPSLSYDVDQTPIDPLLTKIMATCHGLVTLNQDRQQENRPMTNIVGSQLDLAMFRATGYRIDAQTTDQKVSTVITPSKGTNKSQFGVRKRFPFSAVLQRSSVVVSESGSGHFVFCKGSAEVVKSISRASSIPLDFDSVLRRWTCDGFYVIACAYKEVPKEALQAELKRDWVESDLVFAGFLLFRNEPKEDAALVVRALHDANIEVNMITGDHLETAIRLAFRVGLCRPLVEARPRDLETGGADTSENVITIEDGQSGLVCRQTIGQNEPTELSLATLESILIEDSKNRRSTLVLAMTGGALEYMIRHDSAISPQFLHQIVKKAIIYARIRPSQKTWVVEQMILQGKILGMCGDGTNDCGALKAAHIGLSLSCAEASIVAPFTSKNQCLSDVIDVLKEGRCSLTTSFIAFKFMILYPVIQLMISASLGHVESYFSNNQFLYDDIAVVLLLSMTMLWAQPASRLGKNKALDNIFSWAVLGSVVGQIVLCIMFFAIAWAMMTQQPWFCNAPTALRIALNRTSELSAPPSKVCAALASVVDLNNTNHYLRDALLLSYENNVGWLFGHFQYLIVGISFNLLPWSKVKGMTAFRQTWYRNRFFAAAVLIVFVLLTVTLLTPSNSFGGIFSIVPNTTVNGVAIGMPESFRLYLFMLFGIQLALAAVWDKYAVPMTSWFCCRKTN